MKPMQAPVEQEDRSPAAVAVPARTTRATDTRRRQASRGQVLVIFAAALVTLLSLSAVVIDVSWYWANTLRVQRAADAAALAGVVNLPGNVAGAVATAVTAAGQNGYTLTNGCQADNITPSSVPGICASQDSSNDRQLDVTVSAPVSTFFMRLVGINSITATRASKALYVLPVPMGSPLNYLGVGCFRTQSGSQPVCTNAGNSNGASGIPNATVSNPVPLTGPTAPSQLNSQGFYDSVITKGGNTENGDAYGPANDDFGGRTTNPTYNPAGVYYEVLIPPGDTNGSVYVFDPGYCAVNSSYGAGDHWIAGAQNAVSTYYNLWNTNGNVYATSQFSLVTASGSLFENQTGSDPSAALGGPSGLPACDAYHDKWWQMTTGLPAGLYYLQVTTTKVLTTTNGGQTADPAGTSINASTNAENMFSLETTATGATTPQVFGAGKMVAYNNVNGGDQLFYLAQIPKVDAGKTLEIDLFDVGDVGGQAILYIQSPDGNVYTNASFTFTADSMCANTCAGSGSSITATTSGGAHPYNDTWLTILIPLPSSYGSVGLTPPGETQAGWWKIDYRIAAGVQSNDTTTWRVGVRGNPVHLIVP
jgi:Flp pilus assembly protein TadG